MKARAPRAAAPAPPPRVTAARARPQVLRIIGGRWKRSRLPVADRPQLRPTPDRVRETLFNWLGQDLAGWRCLDAFAGTGALGFEAASRGAAQVLLLERDPALANALRATALRLQAEQVRVEVVDALAWMARAAPASFDLVLLDPPYAAGVGAQALAAALPLVAVGGRLYLEAGSALAAAPPGWRILRRLQAGAVHAQLLAHAAAEEPG